ncbi:hypothetical protein QBL21_12770 [Streptomyces sp. 184]
MSPPTSSSWGAGPPGWERRWPPPGAVLCALLSFPFFWLLDTGHSWVVWIAMTLMLTFAKDLMLGAQAAMLPEQFDTRVRYTGVAVSREFAAAIAGGTLPFIAAALTALTGGTWALSTLMIFMCVLSLIGVSGLRDGRDLPVKLIRGTRGDSTSRRATSEPDSTTTFTAPLGSAGTEDRMSLMTQGSDHLVHAPVVRVGEMAQSGGPHHGAQAPGALREGTGRRLDGGPPHRGVGPRVRASSNARSL